MTTGTHPGVRPGACATMGAVPVIARFLVEPTEPFDELDRSGPALHSAVLRAVRARDEQLADELHRPTPAPRPLVVKPLVRRAAALEFAVVVLDDLIGAAVVDAVADRPGFRLVHTWATMRPVTVDKVSYEQLWRDARPERHWHVELSSPCAFRSTHATGVPRATPYPDPCRMADSLARRLRAFAPHHLAGVIDLAEQVAARRLAVGEYQLRTARRLVKAPDLWLVGAHGQVRFDLVGPVDDEAASAVDVLFRFAELAGIGDRTAMGMGDVRVRRRLERSGHDGRAVQGARTGRPRQPRPG